MLTGNSPTAKENMSDDEDETICPLCVEEMDLSDKNFLPCPCGYRVSCMHYLCHTLNDPQHWIMFGVGLYVVLASYSRKP